MFAGEHPLRFAFSLLALQIALLVLVAVLPQDWFAPAWFKWEAAEQLTHFSTVWTIQATLAALVYGLRRRVASCPRGRWSGARTLATVASALVGGDAPDIPREVWYSG